MKMDKEEKKEDQDEEEERIIKASEGVRPDLALGLQSIRHCCTKKR